MVTGASSGLGEAIARRFAAEGASVVIADLDRETGEALALDIGGAARFQLLDLTQEDQWLAAMAAVTAVHRRLDVLVNNAGITTVGSIESLSVEKFRTMLEIDLVGVFLGCKHVIPLMRGTGGSVINMSSICGIRAQRELAASRRHSHGDVGQSHVAGR